METNPTDNTLGQYVAVALDEDFFQDGEFRFDDVREAIMDVIADDVEVVIQRALDRLIADGKLRQTGAAKRYQRIDEEEERERARCEWSREASRMARSSYHAPEPDLDAKADRLDDLEYV